MELWKFVSFQAGRHRSEQKSEGASMLRAMNQKSWWSTVKTFSSVDLSTEND